MSLTFCGTLDGEGCAPEEEIDAEDALEVRQAAVEVARATLDFHLRHRPTTEVDHARFELWARQVLIDAEDEDAAGLSGDVISLEWTLDRFAHALNSADRTAIQATLTELAAAVEEEDFSAASEHAQDLIGD